jgi:hypothetical protein
MNTLSIEQIKKLTKDSASGKLVFINYIFVYDSITGKYKFMTSTSENNIYHDTVEYFLHQSLHLDISEKYINPLREKYETEELELRVQRIKYRDKTELVAETLYNISEIEYDLVDKKTGKRIGEKIVLNHMELMKYLILSPLSQANETFGKLSSIDTENDLELKILSGKAGVAITDKYITGIERRIVIEKDNSDKIESWINKMNMCGFHLVATDSKLYSFDNKGRDIKCLTIPDFLYIGEMAFRQSTIDKIKLASANTLIYEKYVFNSRLENKLGQEIKVEYQSGSNPSKYSINNGSLNILQREFVKRKLYSYTLDKNVEIAEDEAVIL